MPFCMAVAFLEGDAGLAQFTDAKSADSRILELGGRIRYVIDPANDYPRNYTGHIRVTLHDGAVIEFRQPHFRRGVREPLTRSQLVTKFRGNVALDFPRFSGEVLSLIYGLSSRTGSVIYTRGQNVCAQDVDCR